MPVMARNAAKAAIVGAVMMPLTVLSAPALRAQGVSPPAVTVDCGDALTSLTCAELVPTPDLREVRARLTLTSPSSPFGVSVTADGRPRVRAAVDIDGLPDPSTLGGPGGGAGTQPYRAYVAWLTTLTMSQETLSLIHI